jgi:hypothetical protein
MDTKKLDAKIDDAAKETQGVAASATAKGAQVAQKGSHVVAETVANVEKAIKKGGNRLQETAERARHVVDEAAVKVAHAVQETAQKALDGAKEMASKAEHQAQAKVPVASRSKP